MSDCDDYEESASDCDCDDCGGKKRGPQGFQGLQGPLSVGEIGYQGFQGLQGESVPEAGMRGWQGARNSFPGEDGPQGFDGTQGPFSVGNLGNLGWQGDAFDGFQGIQGLEGLLGNIGLSVRGPQGFQQEDAKDGMRGDVGPLNTFRGPLGAQGPQGTKFSWPNYLFADSSYLDLVVSSSTVLGSLAYPPMKCLFMFSCMAYCTPGTTGTIEVWQNTSSNVLSTQPFEFPLSRNINDRICFSTSVLTISNGNPIVVVFQSNPAGTFLNMEHAALSLVQMVPA